jgi:hypothetical protein
MTSDQTGVRAAGAWLAGASLLLTLALGFHGPLHPDVEMQMARIGQSASRWAAVHWAAAAACSCFAIAAVLVLVSHSRLTSTGATNSAWAVVLVGALWTLTTAVTEVTVIADLAESGNAAQFGPWWSFAQGYGNGFAILAIAVAVIAWNEHQDVRRLLPKWSAALGTAAGLASFAGWVLGVWFDVRPANVLWLLASGVMCLWLAWLGVVLARPDAARSSMDIASHTTA